MTYGSLFSGAGGFDLGFEAAGMDCRWLSEIEPKCQDLLSKRWPSAKLYGDITKIRAGDLKRVDVVVGGSPCQDLSVAGKRKGMAGGRSGLFHEMVRICKRVRPRFVVWENVDGAFSSNDGRDFAAVLRAFTGVQVEVPVDGWGRAGFIKTPFPAWRWNCAWRVFDAQYFGVPQRRRRVFLVGSLGDGSCAEVLFEPESLRGDSPPSRKAGQRVAGTVASRPSGGGRLGTDFDLDGGLVPEVAGYLDCGASGAAYSGQDAYQVKLIPDIAFALTTRNERNEPTTETLIPSVPIAFNHQAGGSACPISPSEDRANCLQVGQQQAVSLRMGVRRLTPKECERLMGWPDLHTAGYADSTRYKMCGNGVVAPCAAWIARRIKQFLT